MSRLFRSAVILTLLSSFIQIPTVQAGDCFSDPIIDHDWSGTVASSGAFVRDVACMEGSSVMTTLSSGTTVKITGETDGWWRVQLANGVEGWVGQTLITPSTEPFGETSVTLTVAPASLSSSAAAAVRSSTLGYILLQVEEHGEAWYVDPVTKARYYMKDGPTAYEMMRTFGLGMNEADYAKLAAGNKTLINSLKGRIVLRVEAHGEAYYVHPDGTVYYLADGPAAYALMREHSLGITNLNLTAITAAELKLIPYDQGEQLDSDPVAEVLGTQDEAHDDTVVNSQYQEGLLPSAFAIADLNAAWIDRLNEERVERGVAPVEADQRLVDSATVWATYIGEAGSLTHVRPYGESLLGWIGGFNYDFQEYGTASSWTTNMFGENLALVYTSNSASGMEAALNQAIDMFMDEEPENGPHYRNVVSTDWNTSGIGVYFDTYNSSLYKMYVVFHFASLEN